MHVAVQGGSKGLTASRELPERRGRIVAKLIARDVALEQVVLHLRWSLSGAFLEKKGLPTAGHLRAVNIMETQEQCRACHKAW